jgi:SAM-dependent methyltransferase
MTDGYNPEFFSALFDVEDRHFWFTARNRAIAGVVAHATQGLARGYRVLEVGCGTGYTLKMLEEVCSGGRVFGMDLYLEGLKFARRRTSAPLLQGRMEAPPFSTGFNVVGMFDVLEHLADDRGALSRIRALLVPDGCFVVTVPAGRALWSRFDEESQHQRRYEADDLREKLVTAGFRVDYLTRFMATLYPIARAGRFVSDRVRRRRRMQGRDEGSAVLDEIRIRPVINGVLSSVLAQEARLLERGWTLPMGTSLLAMARPSA